MIGADRLGRAGFLGSFGGFAAGDGRSAVSLSRFVQICPDGCGLVRILGGLFRFSPGRSRFVRVVMQAIEAGGAGQRALAL